MEAGRNQAAGKEKRHLVDTIVSAYTEDMSENPDRLPVDDQWYAEEVGLLFDLWSWPRMAGRVWAVLMVAEDEPLSADQLSERLQASSGSISAATRFLLSNGLIERVRVAGERRDFFRFSPESLRNIYAHRVTEIGDMHRMAERAMARFRGRATGQARLAEMHDFFEWLEQELDALVARWKQERSNI